MHGIGGANHGDNARGMPHNPRGRDPLGADVVLDAKPINFLIQLRIIRISDKRMVPPGMMCLKNTPGFKSNVVKPAIIEDATVTVDTEVGVFVDIDLGIDVLGLSD